jgi:serine phosphatase RsbU (regulator of sigma subunit)
MITATRLGVASAVAGVIWIGGLALSDAGTNSPWVMAGGALLLGGCSTLINGVVGREMVRRKEHQRDLQAAVRIQRSLFPSALPEISGCDFAMACRMSRAIGGDCVDAFALTDGRLAMLVGDVSGKGIAAALVMSGVQAQFRSLAQVGLPLARIAEQINTQLLDQGNGRYVTAVLLVVDTRTGTLEYLSAGHVPFVCLVPGETPTLVHSTSQPLGLLPGVPRTSESRPWPAGSALLLVTDGITERQYRGTDYGVDRLLSVTAALEGQSAQRAVDTLIADNDAFAQRTPAEDDLTVVVVRHCTARDV